MKKYIFTESQIKKIIDNQLNEDFTTSAVGGNGGVTSSISHFVLDNQAFSKDKGLLNKLRSLTYVVLTVEGAPTIRKNNKLLKITKGMRIAPNDVITLKPSSGNPQSLVYDGDRVLLMSATNSSTQIYINAENGKLVGGLQGA